MPYIDPQSREVYDACLDDIKSIPDKGALEYCIFKLMRIYMSDKIFRYSTLHDCTYAAQHCADEFRRRFLDRREDEALELNGDI